MDGLLLANGVRPCEIGVKRRKESKLYDQERKSDLVTLSVGATRQLGEKVKFCLLITACFKT